MILVPSCRNCLGGGVGLGGMTLLKQVIGTGFDSSKESCHSQCVFLCFLFMGEDVSPQLFLPLCLCFTIIEFNSLKLKAQLNVLL